MFSKMNKLTNKMRTCNNRLTIIIVVCNIKYKANKRCMVTKEVIYDTHINHFNEYKVIKDLLPGIYICSNLNRL